MPVGTDDHSPWYHGIDCTPLAVTETCGGSGVRRAMKDLKIHTGHTFQSLKFLFWLQPSVWLCFLYSLHFAISCNTQIPTHITRALYRRWVLSQGSDTGDTFGGLWEWKRNLFFWCWRRCSRRVKGQRSPSPPTNRLWGIFRHKVFVLLLSKDPLLWLESSDRCVFHLFLCNCAPGVTQQRVKLLLKQNPPSDPTSSLKHLLKRKWSIRVDDVQAHVAL